jgi:two-component system response regulator HydG
MEKWERDFWTCDPATLAVLATADRIAAADVPVLIYGESGTGKELIARRIHRKSKRSAKPIVSLNCGALQETLLLSELFGHEKGAFTGATAPRRGLVEEAHGGTLFLDEIGEMGAEAQAKLLRFLQEGEFFRVGGRQPIRVDVRVLAATNRDLEERIRAGAFRQDLLYRINTVVLKVPPLRERGRDIPLLLEKFLEREAKLRKRPLALSPATLEYLLRYRWPGNVRELENLAQRLAVLVEGERITEADLPENVLANASGDDAATSLRLDDVERRHILRVLAIYRGNKTRAAEALGVTVKTLYNKLARYRQRQTPPSPRRAARSGEPALETPLVH